MKTKNEKLNTFFIGKYMIVYIYITSILSYLILNFILKNQNGYTYLIFRIYYISLSITIFILLNQVKKIYKRYVSEIIVMFFLLIIFISSTGLIINIYEKNSVMFGNYIDLSRESILFIETLASYILSEYYLKKREVKIESYSILVLIIICTALNYFSNSSLHFIRSIYYIVEILAFIKIILNLKKSLHSKEQGWSIIKIYIFSAILIFIISIYGLYNNLDVRNALIEIIDLINFRILWNFIIFKLVREPYRTLSASLNEKNKELDELNYKIVLSNKELENSINLLKSKEYLYSTFFRFMPHPIIIINSDNDRILFINRQFLKLVGIDKKRDVVNKKITNYIEFIQNNIENKDYNAILYARNKRKFIEAKFLNNYEDSTKKLILIKDKTSKVQTEEIRKEVENKKIEETIRTEFLSSISHDLKTPINVIYSAMQVEKIYIKKADLEVLKKYNNISKQNCISLIKLTNNLIDNSKINSHYLTPTLENINIVEVIEDNVMSLVDYVKLNNVDLIFDTNTEECYLKIDYEFMYRIILNLVSNAVKFTSDGGKIYVIINDSDDIVNISVKDSGSGIEQEFIYKAFNRYSVGADSRTDCKSGTGIGLCVVKQLIELQGGKIEIKRNDDLGTTVSMEFKKESRNE